MSAAHAAGVTQTLARFVRHGLAGAVPAEVGHAARRAVLDFVGVAIAGARHPAALAVSGLVAAPGGQGPCSIIGSAGRTDPVNAALANGVSAHVLDWDDTILPTRAHLSAALLPPLFAAGEVEGWTLADIVPAFAVGFELSARLNHAVYPAIHNRGWQGTGIVGGMGAAAAVGRMLGLNEERLAHAIGIAGTNGSGLIATFGSMSKAVNIGRAAASGLQSAFLAARGFTSHPDILGSGRLLEMYDEAPRHARLTDQLGERWSIEENGYKLYPCGFVAHATIDAVCELRAQVAGRADLKRLSLRVAPEAMELMDNMAPTNELEAKFSLVYDVAVAWLDGSVTPAAFDDATVRDPRYRSVMDATTITVASDIAQDEAFAEAEFLSGLVTRVHVAHARGTRARPLTDDDLLGKFLDATRMGGVSCSPRLADRIRVGDVPVSALMKLASDAHPSGA